MKTRTSTVLIIKYPFDKGKIKYLYRSVCDSVQWVQARYSEC